MRENIAWRLLDSSFVVVFVEVPESTVYLGYFVSEDENTETIF